MEATVAYQIATYSGTINVQCDPDDDNETIINKAKRILKGRVGHFPFGYESWRVVERR